MKRRTFIAGLGSATAWPVVAQAQQPDRVPRIGVFGTDENDPVTKTLLSAFTQALADFERALNFPRLCPPRNSRLCSIRAHCLLFRCARNAARRSKGSFMIGGMILLVVAAGVFASTVASMLNDGRRLS